MTRSVTMPGTMRREPTYVAVVVVVVIVDALPASLLFVSSLSLSLARSYLTSLTPIDAFILRPSLPQPAKCHFSRHRLNEAL